MTAQPLHLRHAQPADAQPLAQFAAQVLMETFGPDNRPEDIAAHLAQSFGPAQQGRELADPDYVSLVMDGSVGIAAYAQVRRATPPG